jgi:hypothetical protein
MAMASWSASSWIAMRVFSKAVSFCVLQGALDHP